MWTCSSYLLINNSWSFSPPVTIWRSAQNNDCAPIKFLVPLDILPELYLQYCYSELRYAAQDEVWLPFCVVIVTTRSPNCGPIEQHHLCLQAALLSICGERERERGRGGISVLLNKEAVELEPPAPRNPYIGRTRGTIDHVERDWINGREKRAAERGDKERKQKDIYKKVKGRKKKALYWFSKTHFFKDLLFCGSLSCKQWSSGRHALAVSCVLYL